MHHFFGTPFTILTNVGTICMLIKSRGAKIIKYAPSLLSAHPLLGNIMYFDFLFKFVAKYLFYIWKEKKIRIALHLIFYVELFNVLWIKKMKL